ncbi:MAG: response regulator transcription factor [Nesterenkonia sp.]|nr:response regulator transcription factor [Nesterenkonia sp.]
MATVLVLSDAQDDALPALDLLGHRVRTMAAQASSLVHAPDCDVVFVDGRTRLAHARSLCALARETLGAAVVAVMAESGLAALNEGWGIDDFVLTHIAPAELEARIRLGASHAEPEASETEIRAGGIVIDETTYMAAIRGRMLNLTYKEFELLKHLALHPGQVFTREQLLQDVWGYDYFGGTRTVDVHIRRLRAKLGSDHESLIGTVRNVGYRLVAQAPGAESQSP